LIFKDDLFFLNLLDRYCPPKLATLGVVWGSFSALGEHLLIVNAIGIDIF